MRNPVNDIYGICQTVCTLKQTRLHEVILLFFQSCMQVNDAFSVVQLFHLKQNAMCVKGGSQNVVLPFAEIQLSSNKAAREISEVQEGCLMKYVINVCFYAPDFRTGTFIAAILRCREVFSRWECGFHWKLCCCWLEGLRRRRVAVIMQGPGICAHLFIYI